MEGQRERLMNAGWSEPRPVSKPTRPSLSSTSQQPSQPHMLPSNPRPTYVSSLKPPSPKFSTISIGPSLAESSRSPQPPSPPRADNSTGSHMFSQSLPRVTAKAWSVQSLCQKFTRFKEVRRISAQADPATLAKALDDYEVDGIPLIIEDWHKHTAWPSDIFSLEWLLKTAGDEKINVRNMHDRQDQSMTLSEFVDLSRSQPYHAVAGETQRLYWKDADCPPAWRQWLLESGTIPSRLLPGSTDDYLGYLSSSEAIESLLCYMGIGDTYTAAHKDLCASSGHNLMCFAEQDGSSFWFMTAANDAPAVARYFQTELKQELDWETHVTTVEELGRAPFDVYVTEQKVGDLVLVPPRSCHQVVNKGGLAMKTSWSRMTLDNLRTALHCELPIYRRVCRPEQYRVKTILYKSVLHLTEELQLALNPDLKPRPEAELAVTLEKEDVVGEVDNPSALGLVNYESSTSSSRASTPEVFQDIIGRAKKLKQLLQLFDEVLCEEFASCHEKLRHALNNEGSSGWGLTPHFAGFADGDVHNKLMLTLSPPINTHGPPTADKAKERRSSCNLACDFCGADMFQSFFECKECRSPGPVSSSQIGDGLLVCAACYVEGRLCKCGEMEPVQYRRFEVLVSDRNQAARLLSRASPGEGPVPELRMQDLLPNGFSVFEAACNLHRYRNEIHDKLWEVRKCRASSHLRSHKSLYRETLNCSTCHGSKCFPHLLEQGTHAAEALIAVFRQRKSKNDLYHAVHVVNMKTARHSGDKLITTDIDGTLTPLKRLLVAALNFPRCRPGHQRVQLGFYDCENEAQTFDLPAPKSSARTPVTPALNTSARLDPDIVLDSGSSSPLTSVCSDSESGGSPRKDGDEMRRRLSLPPQSPRPSEPSHSPQPSRSARTADDDVIELFTDTESDPELPQPPLPARTAYVEVPSRPRYALESRAASLALETSLPSRKRPRAATVDDPEHVGPLKDGGSKKNRIKPPTSTARPQPSWSPTPEDAGNACAQGLAQALTLVHQEPPVFSQEMPRGVKKPSYSRAIGRRVIESDTEDGSALSTSAKAASSNAAPAPQKSRVAMAPPEATSTQEKRPQPSDRPAAPPLPRTTSLKRVRTEDSLDVDEGTALHPVPDDSTDIGASTVRKKRKGPPGIRRDEMVPAFISENKANAATSRRTKGIASIADRERGSIPRIVGRVESDAVERPRPVRPHQADPPRSAAKEVTSRRQSITSRPTVQERSSSNLATVITMAASGNSDVHVRNTVAPVNSAAQVAQPPEPTTVIITSPGPSNAPAPVPPALPPATPTTHYHAPYSVSAHTSLIASYPPAAPAVAPPGSGAQADPLLSVSQVLENSRLSAIHHTDALFGAIRDLLQQCKHGKEEQKQLKEMIAKLEESYKQTAQGLKQQAEELRITKEELLHAKEDSRRVQDEWRREREDKHHMAISVRRLEEKVAKLEAAQPPACEHRCEPFGPENHGMLRSVVSEIVQATLNQRLAPHPSSSFQGPMNLNAPFGHGDWSREYDGYNHHQQRSNRGSSPRRPSGQHRSDMQYGPESRHGQRDWNDHGRHSGHSGRQNGRTYSRHDRQDNYRDHRSQRAHSRDSGDSGDRDRDRDRDREEGRGRTDSPHSSRRSHRGRTPTSPRHERSRAPRPTVVPSQPPCTVEESAISDYSDRNGKRADTPPSTVDPFTSPPFPLGRLHSSIEEFDAQPARRTPPRDFGPR